MSTNMPAPIILLLHDGELSDIRQILDDVGAVYLEWIGTSTRSYEFSPWDLVICTGDQLATLDVGAVSQNPIRMVILDKETEITDLHSDDADYVVRRPVHPTALRLLIGHVLYSGPERRDAQRVAVGLPVHFRSGFRRRSATLIDLSVSGCRILSSHTAQFGAKATIYFPPEFDDGRPFSAKGRIVRVDPGEGEPFGLEVISIRFDESSIGQLRNAVELHVRGPASLEPTTPVPASSDSAFALTDIVDPSDPEKFVESGESDELPAPDNEIAIEEIAPDRRLDIRVAFPRRVVSLGEASAHVLIGRDLSIGGMWVEPNEWLEIGNELRVALHARAGQDPLVVEARVDRGDPTSGFALLFHNMSNETLEYLTTMLDALPDIDICTGDETKIVLTSIVKDDAPC